MMGEKRRLSTELVKSATVKTNKKIYDELRQLRPIIYKYASSEGVDLKVEYADTAVNSEKFFKKVIVCIHGQPGCFTHFSHLIEHFRDSDIRVIAPNLPDFSHTRSTKTFWHSTPEKVQFLKDFLHQLNVYEIDCIISHSFGIQTIAAIWEDPNFKIKSVALFAAQPLWHLKNKEANQMRRMFYFNSELWYKFLSFTRIHKLPTMPLRLNNINELLLVCTAALDDQSPIDLHRRIKYLAKSKIPVTLLYGSHESLVPKSSIKKLHENLGIKPEDVVVLDVNQHSANDCQATKHINSYLIQNAGHFVHANFHQFSNRMVENLLNFEIPM